MELRAAVKIDQKNKDLIAGYIREYEIKLFGDKEDNPYYKIPKIINHLCLVFWYEGMGFDRNLCGENFTLFNDDKSVECHREDKAGSVFGTASIPSLINKTYIWKIKFIGSNSQCLNLGIFNETACKETINGSFHTVNQSERYSVHMATGTPTAWRGRSVDQCQEFINKGDICTVKLSFNAKKDTLSFRINEDVETTAFEYIKRGTGLNYRFAVSMHEGGNAVEMIDFIVVD